MAIDIYPNGDDAWYGSVIFCLYEYEYTFLKSNVGNPQTGRQYFQ